MSWLLAPLTAFADVAPLPPHEDVAAQVASRCGDLDQLTELAFTFVVEKDGAEVVRRSHRWQPRASQLAVTLGEATVSMSVESAMPAAADDPRWAGLAPGVPPEQAMKAWSAFVNDGYWLLAPCKVTDTGAQLQSDGGGSLTVRYDGVGLTPGDVYVFSLDDAAMVTDWAFSLVSGREGKFVWAPDEAVGPLRLSLQRQSPDGATVIRFADVSAR